MKTTLPTLLAVAILVGLLHDPKPAFGQSKEIGALQRDIYDLQRKIDELKTGQTERSSQTEGMLKQVLDANAALTAELKVVQETIRKNQTEQQTRLIEPLSAVKIGVEDISGGVSALQASQNTMRGRQEKMESSLNDFRGTLTLILNKLEEAHQAPPVSATPATPSDAAAVLFAAAASDKLEGKAQSALNLFGEVMAKYPESPLAPKAVYEMGSLYAEAEQYDQALKAFDRVLEQFGENPMQRLAQFRKAEQLDRLGQRANAAKEYNAFARKYPGDDNATIAISRAKDLSAAPAKPPAKGKR